jgi:hypothetical protein
MRKGSKSVASGRVKISKAPISKGEKNTPGGNFRATKNGDKGRLGNKR